MLDMDVLSDVLLLVLWPYNCFPQFPYLSSEVSVSLDQIAKLSSNTLAGCAELGSSTLVAGFLFSANYLPMYCWVPLIVWGSHFRVGCQVSSVYCICTFNLSVDFTSAVGGALNEF